MSEVTSIWDEVGAPSAALQYMVDGLRAVEKSKDFDVDMGSFYQPFPGGGTCFVCAATSALMQMETLPSDLEGSDYGELSVVEDALPLRSDIVDFECAMDLAGRQGRLGDLFEYLGFHREDAAQFNKRWDLNSPNWKEQLPIIEDTITELEALDL